MDKTLRRAALIAIVSSACTAETPTLLPEGGGAGGKADGMCATVPANIAPHAAPPFSCGPVDDYSARVMGDVNRFWGSNVGLCACGPDYDGPCIGASSRFTLGWVYVEQGFLPDLASSSGSHAPSAYSLAHELGHEVQGHNGVDGHLLHLELGADCLAGYYLGSLECRGQLPARDLQATLSMACLIADGTGDPVHDLQTHGTCEQRVEAVKRGLEAYRQLLPPLVACHFE